MVKRRQPGSVVLNMDIRVRCNTESWTIEFRKVVGQVLPLDHMGKIKVRFDGQFLPNAEEWLFRYTAIRNPQALTISAGAFDARMLHVEMIVLKNVFFPDRLS